MPEAKTEQAPAAKPKRKMLTAEERVAKAEAELKELKAKAEAKRTDKLKELRTRRAGAKDAADKASAKVKAIDAEIAALEQPQQG